MVGIETDMCGLTRNSRLRQERLDAQLLVAAIAVGTFDRGCQVAVFPARRARHDIGDAEPAGERGGIAMRRAAGADAAGPGGDRKGVVWGKSVCVRVECGGRAVIKKKKR